MTGHTRNMRVGDMLDGIRTSGILRNRTIGIFDRVRLVIVDDVFEHRAEPQSLKISGSDWGLKSIVLA